MPALGNNLEGYVPGIQAAVFLAIYLFVVKAIGPQGVSSAVPGDPQILGHPNLIADLDGFICMAVDIGQQCPGNLRRRLSRGCVRPEVIDDFG